MSANEETNDDAPIVCLACGGIVVENGPPAAGVEVCRCHGAEPASAGSIQCPSCGGSLVIGARACPYCHSAVATQRCGSCLAWNLSDARHCHDCGVDLAGNDNTKSAEKTGQLCPRCNGGLSLPLVRRRYADLRVNECDACGGMMLDVAMMTKVVDVRDKSTDLRLALPQRAANRETAVHYLTCPVCKKSMNRRAFGRISGIVVDVCRQDGVWFDAGELAGVLEFVARGGLEEARRREMGDLQESKRAAHAAALQAAAVEAGHAGTVGDIRTSNLERDLEFGREILAAFKSLWS